MNWFTIEFGLVVIVVIAAIVFRWGFKNLPRQAWQIAVAVPSRHSDDLQSVLPAVNLTSYGFISAAAYATALAIYIFLIGSARQPLAYGLLFAGLLLLVAVPASKWVARWVEGVPGHTIGGATFAAMVVAFPSVELVAAVAAHSPNVRLDVTALIAAASIAYAFGEAIGRLACLSFGCCYGRPIDATTPLQRALYSRFTETYRGRFKKISYASGLCDRPVIAVQAISCVVLLALGVIALWCFWHGAAGVAIVVALGGSQLWRAYSEQLRADYRGREGFTVYQGMALLGALAALVFTLAYPVSADYRAQPPSAITGWFALARIEVLLAIQLLALGILFYMGKSSITSSRLELILHAPRQK